MGTFVLFGLCTCLLIGSGMTAKANTVSKNTKSCGLNQFLMCAQHVGNVETPQNMTGVCEDLQKAYSCVEDLWKSCGYSCSSQLKTQANAGQTCGLRDKKTFGKMNKTADPCSVIVQLKKCKDDNCPAKDKPDTSVNQGECTLDNHFRCAAVIDKMEDRSVMENKGTCPVLKEAITCIENLWSGCGYDCTKTYKDYFDNKNYTCNVHNLHYQLMNLNLVVKEHPCVVLKTLKDCLPNCPDETSKDGSSTDSVRRLDQLDLDNEITDILENRKCDQNAIDEFLKKYNSEEARHPNKQTCKEIKLTRRRFIRVGWSDDRPGCNASTVQTMVVDVLVNGVDEYLKQCEERDCSEKIMRTYNIVYNYTSNENKGKPLDCDACYLTKSLIEVNKRTVAGSRPPPTKCEGTKVQRLTMDIMKVGADYGINHCDTKCDASSLSSPLIAICLLAIAYVFSV